MFSSGFQQTELCGNCSVLRPFHRFRQLKEEGPLNEVGVVLLGAIGNFAMKEQYNLKLKINIIIFLENEEFISFTIFKKKST